MYVKYNANHSYLIEYLEVFSPWVIASIVPSALSAPSSNPLFVSKHSVTKPFPLSMADEGAKVRIHTLRAGRALALRLTELGLNVGCEIRVIQRQGGGLLVARGEGRIAIGGGMAAKILVVPA